MNVKELKKHLEEMEDTDRVSIEFPDMDIGGYTETHKVAVSTVDATYNKRGKIIIIADLL